MKPSPADTHVVIAGAGIAGLAAAMILAEAGVRVTLCEAASEAGGKAKSLRLADGHPTEHSLRVYTDTYQTLLTLFSRIPTEHDRTVLDNLVGVSMVSATAQGVIGRIAAPVALQRRRPTFARIIGKVVEPPRQLVRILLRGPMVIVGLAQRGVPATDVLHYLYAHLRLLWMCRERLLAELGDISYADYLQLGCKSAQAQEFFSAVPRIYVAARTSAEAAAIAPIVLKGLFRLKSNCPSALNDAKLPAIMMMDGPTSERMVDPWIRHLTRLGVDIHFNTRVGDLEFDDGRVTALISSDGRRFACDYALLAVPYLTLRELAKSAHVKRYLPQLTQQHALALEASNGIQCFLRDLPATWPPFIRPGVALGLLTLGLIKGPDWGWASLPTSGSLLAAAVAMVGFVMSSRHHPAPMVEPTLLRIQSFVAGTGLTAVASAGFYAYLLTHVLFLNYVWGYTLLEAGMAVAPAALVAAVVAAVLGRVADRHGYRFIVGIGALIWAASLLWYLKVVGSQPDFLGEWLPGQILQGIGVGATFPLLGSAALARLAKGGSYATASAVTGTIRQVGAVIGVAVLVILVGTPAPGAAEEALRHGWALAAICFVAVGIGALSLGRIRPVPAAVEPPPGPPVAPLGVRRPPRPAPVASPAAAVAPTPKTSREVNLLEALRFARPDTQQIELQAGSYLFHAGDVSDALYVVRSGRLQVLAGDGAKDEVVAELGRGQVVGELGVLLDAPRSASVRAVRDSSLMRVTKAEFAKIADAGVLGALAGVLAKRQHQTRVASQRTTPEVVVAVVGVDANAPVAMVATELCRALSTRLRAVAPGRVDCDGLERAEQTADRVVLHAAVGDARWREFCLRVADRVVLVASNPAVPVAPLPTRATGADLVLAGRPAGREHRRAWEQLITPRSMHVVRREFVADDLRVLATRIAGRSVGLVLSGGAARACAHLGVLEELEAAGVTVDRFAGTSMGAIIAALAASGLDAAGVDAQIYEHFVRKSHGDYTLPSKGLIRGKRTQSTLRTIFGDHLVEELPKHFRCVSVDLLARRPVVHRQGPLADVVGCSMRLPFLYAPLPYGGTLHVDGGVLDNVPVTTLVGKDGPLIAVNVASGGNPSPASGGHRRGKPRVPGLTDTLLRTMTISSAMASEKVLAQADLVIKPNPIGVGLMEYHQIDRAREAGRIAAREALPQIMELVHG